MNILQEFFTYAHSYRNIKRQIKLYGDTLYYEPWFYGNDETNLKISDSFSLQTPDIYFDAVKYNVAISSTKYRFTLHDQSMLAPYPQHTKLFNILFAPLIFRQCMNRYKSTGKQQ